MSNEISITGTWGDITLVCTHRHVKPVEMVLQQGGTSLFYACPKYRAENREPDERACNNRLSLEDFEKMLGHIDEIRRDCEMNSEKPVLTHHAWKDRKSTEYTVLEHKGDAMTIGVFNKRAINK
jgi:hypothetical protein